MLAEWEEQIRPRDPKTGGFQEGNFDVIRRKM
jgi:hypothetical protein